MSCRPRLERGGAQGDHPGGPEKGKEGLQPAVARPKTLVPRGQALGLRGIPAGRTSAEAAGTGATFVARPGPAAGRRGAPGGVPLQAGSGTGGILAGKTRHRTAVAEGPPLAVRGTATVVGRKIAVARGPGEGGRQRGERDGRP